MPLSDLKVRNLRPAAKPFKTADASGLYVLTNPTGSKLWRMDYRFLNKRKTLALGNYPAVTLLEARRLRDDARRMIEDGVDPSHARQAVKIAQAADGETFRTVADRWFHTNSKQLVGAYAMRLKNRLVDDVYPTLGDMQISTIRAKDVLGVIRKIEGRGAIETGRRVYQMISNIFKFAVAEDIIDSDPSRDISAALAPPNPVKHRASIKASEIPELMGALDQYHGEPVTSLALKLVAHTFVRSAELRFAEWSEFEDLNGPDPTWRIPSGKMKMRREHVVPLSRQAVALVRKLREINGASKWVCKAPGHRDKPISENTMIYAIYRAGWKSRATVHGFRSTASTVLNERQFNRDWIELQLAHVDGSIRGVYNSALYLPQRREMMRWWSDFIEPPDDFDAML